MSKESDLHTKRTGHSDFVDRTMEEAKSLELDAPAKVDGPQEDSTASESRNSEGEALIFYENDPSI